MKKLLCLLALISVTSFANPIDDNCSHHTTLGAPISSIKIDTQYICHDNYAVHYRYDTKTAEYVVEHLDKSDITGSIKRTNNFSSDPKVDDDKEAHISDYKGYPYDRGHLSSASNNRTNKEQMSESFYLTNIIPQDPGHNRGIWSRLETGVRDTALAGNDIYIISGTIYDTGYKTIGNNVGVPTRIWKIIYNVTTGQTIAFLFPNSKLSTRDLFKYVVTVNEVEAITGINVFPKLDESYESTVDITKWKEILK